MAEFLYSIDVSILYFFNHTLSTPFLDKFFSVITNVNNWYITYVILLLVCFIDGGRKGKIGVVLILILIALTDQLSHNIIKEFVQRLRPCNVLEDVITPLGCQGTYSFPSNHAVNNFAAAVFFYLLFPRLKWALFITAALVAISRVYLGLHYPSDILAGAITGTVFGFGFGKAALKLDEIIKLKYQKS